MLRPLVTERLVETVPKVDRAGRGHQHGSMRRLHPQPTASVDVAAAYADLARPRPSDRPWVTMLMIESGDGATVVDGKSGRLGGPGDQLVYRTVRALGDGVLVGAATARVEQYQPLALPRRLLIVTSSGDLGASAPVLDEPSTTLLMPVDAAAPDGVDVVRAGHGHTDLAGALAQLGHIDHVVCEGGPSINGQMLAAGLIDEVCLSFAPRFVAGRSPRLAHGDQSAPLDAWALAHVLGDDDGFLFLCYRRH